jgi:hypothetical protein
LGQINRPLGEETGDLHWIRNSPVSSKLCTTHEDFELDVTVDEVTHRLSHSHLPMPASHVEVIGARARFPETDCEWSNL